ncbi:hypothetical protein [Mycobacterium sp.]|uniref:hypothetical protein n=1 Tax=Mycobacterium sp. TaxID=1785 RepID=UPI00260C97CA|nr:hypothetical protein [Mycobacterium sp.]
MNTKRTRNPTSYPITRRVKPMSTGKCVTLAAVATIGAGTALGLAGHTGSVLAAPAVPIAAPGTSVVVMASDSHSRLVTMQTAAGPWTGPGSTLREAPCPTSPPTNPGRPGDHPPLQPFSLHPLAPCGTDGSISGPGAGGTDPGGGSIDTGGATVCVGDEIECHQPF